MVTTMTTGGMAPVCIRVTHRHRLVYLPTLEENSFRDSHKRKLTSDFAVLSLTFCMALRLSVATGLVWAAVIVDLFERISLLRIGVPCDSRLCLLNSFCFKSYLVSCRVPECIGLSLFAYWLRYRIRTSNIKDDYCIYQACVGYSIAAYLVVPEPRYQYHYERDWK